ncbi:MAG: flagellar basal body-associated FliL family protein [Verrucomicrobia bacterium]|nr:flagellar basal body-associated FliL family protein [Verrucomicrobiota bacterium]
MADNPPAEQTPAAGGEKSATTEAAPAKAGGLSSYVPLIIAVVVMPVAAYVTISIKSKMSSKGSAAHTEEEAEPEAEKPKDSHGGGGHGGSAKPKDSHGGGGHGGSAKPKIAKGTRNVKLAVPLTRDAIAFAPKDPDNPRDVDKIVILDTKGETKDMAQSDKIVVNVANTGGGRYVLARLSFMSDHQEFLDRLNENRERLIDVAVGTLSNKTLEELNRPGYRTLLKSELRDLFNQQLGVTMIQEVVIHDLVIQ